MRVLITGSTGLVGQALGQQLVRHGHRVVSLVRNLKTTRLSYPAEVFEWQGEETPIPIQALVGIEAVINLAGEPIAGGRWSTRRKKAICGSRILGTRQLLEAISKSPSASTLKVFVQGSAVGIYGNGGEKWFDESDPAANDFLALLAKDWEGEASRVQELFPQARLATIRTGIVLSEKGGALPAMLPVFSQGLGAKLGNGDQFMSWIHLDDIVGLFVFALENEKVEGPLNGCAPEPVRNSEFTKQLAAVLKQRTFFSVPEAALRLGMGEMSEVLLFSVRASSEKAQNKGYEFKFSDLRAALQDLTIDMQARDRVLVGEQWVPKPRTEIFDFFSSETNLETLTPPFLNFKVLKKTTPKIEAGTLIDYKLGLHGIPLKWKTLIKEWQPEERFVDEQLEGPYSKWHHTHTFGKLGAGTLIRDRVVYRVPFGGLGALTAGWKVNMDVKTIFDFRKTKIRELFG